jgi:hypothetical protein
MYHVFSHFPCNDGEVASAIWSYFKPDSILYKWKHNDNLNEVNIINNLPEKSNIVFLDITPKIELLSNKHKYIIIDHHKDPLLKLLNHPNKENYNLEIFIQENFPEENDLSGCMLTWDYLSKYKYPSIVYFIGSNDVWDFSNNETEPYCIGYNECIKKCNSENRINFIKNLLVNNTTENDLIVLGLHTINKYKEEAKTYFKDIILTNETINNINYSIIDIECISNSRNSLYKYLIEYAKKHYPTIQILRILHTTSSTQKVYSLRSLLDINVDIIARHYNGNGHEKAAGYTIGL